MAVPTRLLHAVVPLPEGITPPTEDTDELGSEKKPASKPGGTNPQQQWQELGVFVNPSH